MTVPGPQTFFHLHEDIIGAVFCIGLVLWGIGKLIFGLRRVVSSLRKLTKECCDWYEEFQERRRHWREQQVLEDARLATICYQSPGISSDSSPLIAAPRAGENLITRKSLKASKIR